MAMRDNDIKWFRPLWRRVAIVVFLTLWLGYELFWSGDMFWAALVGLALAYSGYNFFVSFPKNVPDENVTPSDRPPSS
jgi:hypothetical protein